MGKNKKDLNILANIINVLHGDESNNDLTKFLFICVLSQKLKGQLRSDHEWNKETRTEFRTRQFILSEYLRW
jgi:hypothetical protein